ncbi:MAG: hypothetical protein NZ937_03405 [Armatimonadetes bacterium]|nr:hypothetical protein [Armatimonadota bacterium]
MAMQVTLDLKQYLKSFGWHKYKAFEEPMEKEGIIHKQVGSIHIESGYRKIVEILFGKRVGR